MLVTQCVTKNQVAVDTSEQPRSEHKSKGLTPQQKVLVVDPEKIIEVFGDVHDPNKLKKSMGYESKEQFCRNMFNI